MARQARNPSAATNDHSPRAPNPAALPGAIASRVARPPRAMTPSRASPAAGPEGGRQGNGRRVGAASAQGGLFPLRRAPLEPGHDRDDAVSKDLAEPAHFDPCDAGAGMYLIGQDAGLASGERAGRAALLLKGHRQERACHTLTCREQHVHLTVIGLSRHPVGQCQEAIRLVAHR